MGRMEILTGYRQSEIYAREGVDLSRGRARPYRRSDRNPQRYEHATRNSSDIEAKGRTQ